MRLLLFLTGLIWAVCAQAQTSEPSITTCDGNQYVCATSSNQRACFRIKLNNFTPQIRDFKIVWDDGKEEVIPYANRDSEIFHVYELKDFGSCETPERYRPELLTYTVADPTKPLSNSSAILFKFPPQSSFRILPGNVACVATALRVLPKKCNQTQNTYNFGDGQGPTVDSTHTYSTAGTYTITHKATGDCGEATSTQTITILDKPTAVAEATAGITVPGDPLKVCLDGNSAQVIISGIKSRGAATYRWTYSPSVSSRQRGLGPIDTLTFTAAGDYTLTLTVDNACAAPSMAVLQVKVIAAPRLSLSPAPDACAPTTYTPSPLLPGASYTINGTPYSNWPYQAGFGTYKVVAALSNECGNQQLTDEFTVALPAEIAIASPTNNLAVCAGGPAIALAASPAGGTWTGSPDLLSLPDGTQLIPATPGTYTLTYATGSGACAKTASRTVTVESLNLQLAAEPDGCQPISYTPTPLLVGASYLIDGIAETTFPKILGFGQHTVLATQTNSCGSASKRDTFSVTAPQDIQVTWPAQDTVVCIGSAGISLRASTYGGRWTGAASINPDTGALATFTPNALGNFTLTYTRGSGACQRSDLVMVRVEGVAVELAPIKVCVGTAAVALMNAQSGGRWSSPDCPTCITGATFTFPSGGADPSAVYSVAYTLTNATGCAGSATIPITVLDPKAAFDVAPEVCTGQEILPIVRSAVAGQTLRWAVDAQAATPPFRNLAAGPHVLLAVAEIGVCKDEFRDTITVIAPPPPIDLIADQTIGCGPLEVALRLTGMVPTNVRYGWNFGRTATDTTSGATLPGPITFVNLTADTLRYTVRVGGANACGDGGDTETITVFPQPFAEIGTDSAFTGCSPYRVLFSNRGSRAATQCHYFGINGLDIRDCRDTFSLVLTAVGEPQIYPIIFEASNTCGTDLDTALITVLPPGITPLFNLDDLDYTVCPGAPLVFSDASTPRPTLLQWDLGDGTTSNADTVRHIYLAADTSFAVRLRVSTGCGYAEQTRLVRVLPRPAGELLLPPFACAKAEVDIRVRTTAPTVRLDFGNGTGLGSAFAKTRYDSAGTYEISAQLQSELGCRDSIKQTLVVNPLPVLLVAGGDTVCVGQRVQVRGSGQYVQSFSWRLPDGSVATGSTADWLPLSAGAHFGLLTGRSTAGCTDSLAFQLFARHTPVAGFGVSGDSTCVPTQITIADLSRGPGISSYDYTFGDGQTETWASGVHEYAVGGRYSLQQIVSIDGICFDTATVSVQALANAALLTTLDDARCVPNDYAFLDVRVGADERVRVQGPGLDSTGGTRFALQRAGNYLITATTPFGCDTTTVLELEDRTPIVLDLRPDTTIQFGDSVQLWSRVNYADLDYRWVPDENFATSEIERPYARPSTSTTYELTVAQDACKAVKTVRITVLERIPVDTPTGFSPNGDGINDVWEIYPNASIKSLRVLRIYDRWGEMVYETKGLGEWEHGGLPLHAWDGYSRGRRMNPAVYVWTLEAETFDGAVRLLVGDVTVVY